MSVTLSFAGAAQTDVSAAGIGLTKVSGDTGAFRLSGWGRAFRAVNSAVHYTHSEALTDADYDVTITFVVDSTTIAERIGVTMRDTTTVNSNRNGVLFRIRTEASTAAFLEIYKIVGSVFTLVASEPVTITSNSTGDANVFSYRVRAVGNQFTVYEGLTGDTVVIDTVTISETVLQNAGRIGMYASPNDPVSTAGATDLGGTGTHIASITQAYLSAGDVEANGSIPEIVMEAPTGSIQAGAAVSGSIPEIVMEAPTGSIVAGTQTNGSIPEIVMEAPTGSIQAGAAVSGGIPEVVMEAPTGTASSGSGLTLVHDFQGGNTSVASSITGADTLTPVVTLVIRNPEGLTVMWQHFRACVTNAAGRTITFRIDTATQEAGSGVLSTWSGPYRANTLSNHLAWTQITGRSMDGTVLTFTVEAGADNTIYIASMPPNTRSQVMSWLNSLIAAYPGKFHDDLPTRVAAAIGPYTCDVAPTVQDENGRTISNEPMLGFRYGDDTVGIPQQKHRIVLLAGAHAGEDHGFIQLRGFMNWFMTAPALAEVRKNVELWIYPIIGANGNALGYRRFEPRPDFAGGDDINKEWNASTTHPTAQKWQAIMAADHGATFDRVKALIDFHDLAKDPTVIVYYYRSASVGIAAIRAVIDARFPSALGLASSSVDTATDYFQKKGVQPSITAEVSDQSTSLAGFLDVGAGWADVVQGWYDAGLLGGANLTTTGSIPEILLEAPTGTVSSDASASGSIPEIVVEPATGSVQAGAALNGSIPEVVIEPATGSASGGSAGGGASAEEIVAAIFGRMVEDGRTFEQELRVMRSVLVGLVEGAGTGVERFKSADGGKDRVVVTVDASGNRTAVAVDGT